MTPILPGSTLNINHWNVEKFTQRMTAKDWKATLLAGNDKIFYRGEGRRLVAKHLGSGVVEVSKHPTKGWN